jgi:hypothetical protein
MVYKGAGRGTGSMASLSTSDSHTPFIIHSNSEMAGQSSSLYRRKLNLKAKLESSEIIS